MGIVEKATVTGPSARTSSPLRRVDSIFVRLTRRLHYPYTRCERNSHSEFSLMNIRSSGPVPRILRNSRGTRPVNSILTFHPFFRPDSFVASRQARFNHRDTLPVTTLPPIECWILFLSLCLQHIDSSSRFSNPESPFAQGESIRKFVLRNVIFLTDKRIFGGRTLTIFNPIVGQESVLIRWLLGSVSAERERERKRENNLAWIPRD